MPASAASSASFYGRYTYARHLRAAGLDAVAAGVLLLNEFVARKALGASATAITLLLMLPSVAQLINLHWTGTGGRDPRKVFLWVGLPARLVLILVAFTHGSASFVVLASIAAMATTVVIPAQNALYQANYAPGERGRLYARVSATAALVTVSVSTLLGWLYDRDESLFRWAYPAGGLLSAAGALAWYRIRWRRRPVDGPGVAPMAPSAIASVPRPVVAGAGARLGSGLVEPVRAAARLFREDRRFLRFEAAFMTYGIAYMMLQPVLPVFLVDHLHVDYSEAAHAKGLLFYLMQIAFLPWAGRLSDRVGPVRVAAASFLLLATFPALMLLARGMGVVYVAYALYGIAMAGVGVTWTVGPLTLAGERSAERYMGVHVGLVGVRALIGYPLGLFLLRAVSAHATFAVSVVLFLCARTLMASLAPGGTTAGPRVNA